VPGVDPVIFRRRCPLWAVDGWLDVPPRQAVAVPVDVGKTSAMVMACDRDSPGAVAHGGVPDDPGRAGRGAGPAAHRPAD
jgi:hypothetical protein